MKKEIGELLSSLGIGGFYLYREYDNPNGVKVTIEESYKKPYNPYEGARLYFFNSWSDYHLKPPVGATKADNEEIK